jgi:hypothetical protein
MRLEDSLSISCNFIGSFAANMASEIGKTSLSDEKVEAINDTAGAHIDAVAEKRLLRKCDLYVLPPLFVLFLLAFLDSKKCMYIYEHVLTQFRDEYRQCKNSRARSGP